MAGAPVEWLATKSGDDDCQPFLDAADQADPEILRLILARRPRVNTRDENGATAFLYTVNGSGSAEGMNVEPALRQLIAAGADPQVRENDGSGAYHNAHRFPKVTAALLRLGVKGIDLPNHEGRTPLMLASEPEVARLLLAAGANPYSKDKQGLTPLDYARKQAKSDASPNTKATLDVVTRWVAEHPQKTH